MRRRSFLALLGGAAVVPLTPTEWPPGFRIHPSIDVDLSHPWQRTSFDGTHTNLLWEGEPMTLETILAAVDRLRDGAIPRFEGTYANPDLVSPTPVLTMEDIQKAEALGREYGIEPFPDGFRWHMPLADLPNQCRTRSRGTGGTFPRGGTRLRCPRPLIIHDGDDEPEMVTPSEGES